MSLKERKKIFLLGVISSYGANAVNMLAGFNGLEAGMGLVAVGSLAVIAYLIGETTAFILSIIMLGALLATLYFNWFPAKVLIGDVGTLTIYKERIYIVI